MNTEVNNEKIEKLNQLKAEQERIEQEIREQEAEAQIELKKERAIKSAERALQKEFERVELLNEEKLNLIKIAEENDIELTVKESDDEIRKQPWTYLPKTDGQPGLKEWRGEAITKPQKNIHISYRNIDLYIKGDNKVELPYEVTMSSRTYRLKTAIRKINEYLEVQHQKTQKILKEKKALELATKHLKELLEKSGAKAEVTSKTTGSIGYDYSRSKRQKIWIEWNEITIQFENGNRLRYKVGYTTNEKFTLNLVDFIDVRISDIKKDPTLSINHLK